MKLRIYKTQMNKALMWYTNKLYEKYSNQLFSPAVIELMHHDLKNLQLYMQTKERNSVWHAPVELLVKPQQHFIEVVVADEKNILYLDDNE